MLIVSSDIRYINIGLDLRMRMIVNRKEKYHLFFHKKENHSLHQLLSADLCETLKPYMEKKLYKMKEKGLTDAACIPMAASFLPVSYTHLDVYKRQERRQYLHTPQ